MRICGIYGIFNTLDAKVLVGSSVNIFGRWSVHRSLARQGTHENFHFRSAWRKYGESVFEFRVLEECAEDMLLIREDAWITYYRSLERNFGYNLKLASRQTLSPETRERIAEANRGQKRSAEARARMAEAQSKRGPFSLETRLKISRALKGRKAWNRGKSFSAESRAKMSASMKGRPSSNKGKVASLETREKQRAAKLGTKRSEEAKRKTSESLKAVWQRRRETQIKQGE